MIRQVQEPAAQDLSPAERERRIAEAALREAGIVQRIPELSEVTKKIFGDAPVVTIETDPELRDDHYVVFQVTVTGPVPEARQLHKRWNAETAEMLGRDVDKIRLMMSWK